MRGVMWARLINERDMKTVEAKVRYLIRSAGQ